LCWIYSECENERGDVFWRGDYGLDFVFVEGRNEVSNEEGEIPAKVKELVEKDRATLWKVRMWGGLEGFGIPRLTEPL